MLSVFLELQETSLCSTIHCRSKIHCNWKLLYLKSLDETIAWRLEVILDHIPLKYDNTSAINLSKNPIKHSRTKHIEIRCHFIRDHVSKGDCCIEFIDSEHPLADIFTKPLARDRLFFIRNELGILHESSIEWCYDLVHATCYIYSLCLSFSLMS